MTLAVKLEHCDSELSIRSKGVWSVFVASTVVPKPQIRGLVDSMDELANSPCTAQIKSLLNAIMCVRTHLDVQSIMALKGNSGLILQRRAIICILDELLGLEEEAYYYEPLVQIIARFLTKCDHQLFSTYTAEIKKFAPKKDVPENDIDLIKVNIDLTEVKTKLATRCDKLKLTTPQDEQNCGNSFNGRWEIVRDAMLALKKVFDDLCLSSAGTSKQIPEEEKSVCRELCEEMDELSKRVPEIDNDIIMTHWNVKLLEYFEKLSNYISSEHNKIIDTLRVDNEEVLASKLSGTQKRVQPMIDELFVLRGIICKSDPMAVDNDGLVDSLFATTLLAKTDIPKETVTAASRIQEFKQGKLLLQVIMFASSTEWKDCCDPSLEAHKCAGRLDIEVLNFLETEYNGWTPEDRRRHIDLCRQLLEIEPARKDLEKHIKAFLNLTRKQDCMLTINDIQKIDQCDKSLIACRVLLMNTFLNNILTKTSSNSQEHDQSCCPTDHSITDSDMSQSIIALNISSDGGLI